MKPIVLVILLTACVDQIEVSDVESSVTEAADAVGESVPPSAPRTLAACVALCASEEANAEDQCRKEWNLGEAECRRPLDIAQAQMEAVCIPREIPTLCPRAKQALEQARTEYQECGVRNDGHDATCRYIARQDQLACIEECGELFPIDSPATTPAQ